MKKYIYKTLKLPSGEVIEVRQNSGGENIWPICGYLLGKGEPPYGETWLVQPDGSKTGPVATPSFDICPSCNMEYGFDDAVEAGKSKVEKWKQLRTAWLLRVGETNQTARMQLQNLDS